MKITPFALAATLCLPSCFPSAYAADAAASTKKKVYPNPYYEEKLAKAAAAAAAAGLAGAAVAVAVGQNNTTTNNNNDGDGTQTASNNDETYGELNYVDEGTEDGYKSAIKLWNNEFAPCQGYARVEHLTKQFVCGEILPNGSLANQNDPPIRKPLSEFANYLLQAKQKSGERKGKHYGVGTILQYLSGVKTYLFKKYKPLAFSGINPDWWSDLYNSLRCRAAVAAISRGESVTKKAIGLSRKALINCCIWLMRQDDASLGYEERCILVILYHAVGRGGEVSTSAWNNAEWNVDHEFLSLKWGEVKNGQQPEMTFHPDTSEWMLDIFHALACYLIAGHGKSKASSSPAATDSIYWMFPAYVDMVKGGAASKASRIIDKCRKAGVEGVVEGANSHGIRVTATDDMTFHHLLSVFATIARGGWDFKSDNLAFYYFTKRLNVVLAGKALAGWHDPRQPVHAPTLDAFVTSANKSKVDEFCERLFASTEVPLLSNELKGFRDAMVASLLMYYEDVKKDLGPGSRIIEAMHQAAVACRISDAPPSCVKTLSEWSKAVRERFIAANAKNLGNMDLTETERQGKTIELLQQLCLQNMDLSKNLLAAVETLKGDVQEIKSMMYQSNIFDSPRAENDKKRSRTASPSFDMSNSSTAIAELSDDPPPPTVNESLQLGIVAEKVDFTGCGSWTCGVFVSKCILGLQDVDSTSRDKLWLGPIDNRQRAKHRRVYRALRNRATDEQKRYFKASRYPKTNVELTAWSKEVLEFIPSLVDSFINEMLQRMHPQDWQAKKKKKNVNVSAVQKLMEHYEEDHHWAGAGEENLGVIA